MRSKIVTAIVIICLLGVGVWYLNREGDQADSNSESIWYTTADIVEAIEQTGVVLEADSDFNPRDYQLAGINPTIYAINNSINHLWLYIFDDINERDEVASDGWLQHWDQPITQRLQTRNVLILQDGIAGQTTINNLINRQMNDLKSQVFGGTSDNWQVRHNLDYYRNEIRADSGKIYLDQAAIVGDEIKYLGPDLGIDQQVVTIKIQLANGSINYNYNPSFFDLKADRYYPIGYNRTIFDADPTQPLTCKISWNGNEEIMDLEPINQ